jgi:hypothetical protein
MEASHSQVSNVGRLGVGVGGTIRASPRERDNWYLVPHSYLVDLQILDVTERTQE